MEQKKRLVTRSDFDGLACAMMLKELGYDFESLYVGGGTPTSLPDDMFAAMLEEGLDDALDGVAALLPLHALRVEPQIEQRAFLEDGLVNVRYRLHR